MKYTNIILLTSLMLSGSSCSKQPPPGNHIHFLKFYSFAALGDICATPDNGFLAFNTTVTSLISVCHLTKFDQYGNKSWDKIIPGINSLGFMHLIDHYLYIAGHNNSGSSNSVIYKSDLDGNIIWQCSKSNFSVNSVCTAKNHETFLAGLTPSGYTKFIRLNDSGKTVFMDTLSGHTSSFPLITNCNDHYLFTCAYFDLALFAPYFEINIIDSMGNILSTNRIKAMTGDAYASELMQVSESRFLYLTLIPSDTGGSSVLQNAYILDSNLNITNSHILGKIPTVNTIQSALCQTTDGGYLLAGTTVSVYGSGISLSKFDAGFNLQWNKKFGENFVSHGGSAIQTTDGSCLVSGLTIDAGQGKISNIFVKTDANGDIK